MAQADYCDHLRNLGCFRTVEEFWSMYTSLARPFHLPAMSHYRVFREGILPMWEAFPNGGSWIIRFKKQPGKHHRSTPALSKCWEELLFAAVGEFFEEPDVIGVVVGVKSSEDVIQIWNRDNDDGMGIAQRIGEKLKTLLQPHLDQTNTLEYKVCAIAMTDKSPALKPKKSPWLVAAASG
jgi:translation initiation factor 4E